MSIYGGKISDKQTSNRLSETNKVIYRKKIYHEYYSFLFIGVKLLYDFVILSAVKQRESAI